MDTCENTAKLVDTTYKNIIDEFGPCIKQLVVAGKTYLKSMHGMSAAYRNYNEALSKVANLADNSTFEGSGDIGKAIHHVVEINREMLAQQSNVLKSLEFDLLEPIEITADKDTKLISREQKRFQQLQKSRKDDFDKSISTLRKTRKKKSTNTDKQLAQMKMMENSKTRLQGFCDESLKEAIVQERIMYGTILEKLCVYGQQVLIYHSKGCEHLKTNMPKWKDLAETKDILPNNCFALHATPEKTDVYSIYAPAGVDGAYHMGSPVDSDYRSLSRTSTRNQRDDDSLLSATSRLETSDRNSVYARPMVRAKSEHNLSKSDSFAALKTTPPNRFSSVIEYDGERILNNCVRAMYRYQAEDSDQLSLEEGDIIGFVGRRDGAGWQFGNNLTSNRLGWFPVSFTEPLQNGQDSTYTSISKNGSTKTNRRPLPPPPPPATVGTARSKATSPYHQSSETSDYGTLKRLTPRRLLPVDPPVVSPTKSQKETDVYQNASVFRFPRNSEMRDVPEEKRYYSNGPLQSMHL